MRFFFKISLLHLRNHDEFVIKDGNDSSSSVMTNSQNCPVISSGRYMLIELKVDIGFPNWTLVDVKGSYRAVSQGILT